MSRKASLIPRSRYWALIFIAILALVEKGAPPIQVQTGASPLNLGGLGTFDFYSALRERYAYVAPAASLSEVKYPYGAEHCLFISISPEDAYTQDEARAIVEELSKCKNPAILVADEYETSNAILEEAGLSARVLGVILFQEATTPYYANATPHVRAVFKLLETGEKVELLLDIASAVSSGAEVLGYAPGATFILRPQQRYTLLYIEAPVAVYDYNEKFKAIVIGDGSIFLNQVLKSRYASNYSRVLLDYVDYLCSHSKNCFIIIGAFKYKNVDVERALSSELQQGPQVVFSPSFYTYAALYAIKLLHPSTWFPPLVEFSSKLVSSILSNPLTAYMALAILILLSYGYVSGKISEGGRIRDEKLSETREVEVYLTGELVSEVARGKYKLTKQDFISLCEIVDTCLRYSIGCSLFEEAAVTTLSKYVGAELARKYVEEMNKLYQKALGKRRLPIVFSWHRTTVKYIKKSNEVLSSIGVSLEAEKGYEYIAMRVTAWYQPRRG